MLYDRYERRISKVARARDFMIVNRAVLIIGFALVLAIVTAFLSVRGVITDELTVSPAFERGDRIDAHAGALFGTCEYEYCVDDGTFLWSTELPTLPNKYLVRARSSRTVGTQYGEPVSFVITPRPLSLEVAPSTVYGEAPVVTANLAEGDTFTFTYEYRDRHASETDVSVTSVTVLDAQGNDVTAQYDTSLPTAKVRFTKRQITISTADISKIYDGTPLVITNNSWSISGGELAYEDAVSESSVVYHVKTLTLGTLANSIDTSVKIMAGGRDVSNCYEISYDFGTLFFSKRDVTLNTKSASRAYDGTALTHCDTDGFTVDGILSGHRARVIHNASITEVGTVTNDIDIVIVDENSVNVTQYYNIIKGERGRLEITKRDVTLSIHDQSVTYNCTAQFPLSENSSQYSITGVPSGVTAAVELSLSSAVKADVGRYGKAIGGTLSLTKGGTDVSKNFNVVINNGDLVVNKLPVTVTVQDTTHIYDGELSTVEMHSTVSSVPSGIGYKIFYSLADGVSANVGTYTDAIIADYEFYFDRKKLDKNNFDITYTKGTLEIVKRDITVMAQGQEKVYDGTSDINDALYSALGLADGMTLTAKIKALSANIGENDIVFDETLTKIFKNGRELPLSNFNIVHLGSKLSVSPIRLAVSTKDIYHEYDNREYSALVNMAEVTGYEPWEILWSKSDVKTLGDGHKIEISDAAVVKYVNDTTFNTFTMQVVDKDGAIVTDKNGTAVYEITVEKYGVIEITPRKIIITLNGTSTEYGMSPTVPSTDATLSFSRADGGIAIYGDNPVNVTFNAYGDAGEYTYGGGYYDGYTVSLGNPNYDVIKAEGVYTITPREIRIDLNSQAREYDRSTVKHYYLRYDDATPALRAYRDDGLDAIIRDENDAAAYVYIDLVTGSWNVGTYIGGSTAECMSLSKNYKVISTEGEYTVSPRRVHLEFYGYSRQYDNTCDFTISSASPNITYRRGGGEIAVMSGDELLLSLTVSDKNVGEYKESLGGILSIELSQKDSDICNYELGLIASNSYVSITAKEISVDLPTVEREYIHSNRYELTIDSSDCSEIYMGDTLAFSLALRQGSDNNVGEYSTDERLIAYCDENANYKITSVCDTALKIVPRRLNLTLSYQRAYDGTLVTYPPYDELLGLRDDRIGTGIANYRIRIITPSADVGVYDDTQFTYEVVDLSDNYIVESLVGTLEIIPRAVGIYIRDDSPIILNHDESFDGIIDLTRHFESGDAYMAPSAFIERDGVIEKVGKVLIRTSGISVGEYTVGEGTVLLHEVVMAAGNADNYSFKLMNGKVIITETALSVEMGSDVEFSGSNVFTLIDEDAGIDVGGVTLGIASSGYNGIYISKLAVMTESSYVGTYGVDGQLQIVEIVIKDERGEDITEMCKINYLGGVSIAKRKLTVNLSGASPAEYNGTNKLTIPVTDAITDNLVAGDSGALKCIVEVENKNVGSRTAISVHLAEGANESNYEIVSFSGELEIIKYRASVSINDSAVFNGSAEFTIRVNAIADDYIRVKLTLPSARAGVYTSFISYELADAGSDAAIAQAHGNIELVALDGSFTVENMTATVHPPIGTYTKNNYSESKVQKLICDGDGIWSISSPAKGAYEVRDPFTSDGVIRFSGSVVLTAADGSEVELIILAGNLLSASTLSDGDAAASTAFECSNGQISIKQSQLTLLPVRFQTVMNGNESASLSVEGMSLASLYNVIGLAKGDKITFTNLTLSGITEVTYTPDDLAQDYPDGMPAVGSELTVQYYTLSFEGFGVVDGEGNDVTDYYSFASTSADGTLTVIYSGDSAS